MNHKLKQEDNALVKLYAQSCCCDSACHNCEFVQLLLHMLTLLQ